MNHCHSVAYKDLPLAALKLDAILYNIFKLSIRGSKQAILQKLYNKLAMAITESIRENGS